jgi:hypothetical protein
VRVNFVSPDEQTAHLGPRDGHPSGEPGQPIRFAVKVTMNLSLPEEATACAELAGYKIPQPGPIEGVPILWSSQVGSENLASYGTVTYEPANQKTDSEGTSTLVFTPASELARWGISGIGKETVRSGTLLADPLVLTGVNSSSVFKPGNVSQLFWGITTKWNVAYHKALGFKFEQVHFQMRRAADGMTVDWWLSGHVCGPTPWNEGAVGFELDSAWTIENRAQTAGSGWRSAVSTSQYSQPMHRSDNGASWNIGSGGKITYLIQPRYPPKMAIEMLPFTGYPLATAAIVTVPLVEDSSCP